MSGMRFTSWLSEDERTALRELAARIGCSENFIVRMSLRAVLFDKQIPDYMRTEVTGVTQVTHNHVTGART